MSLDKAKMEAKLLRMFDQDHVEFIGFPTDIATAAANWTDAYDTYALDAEDASGDTLASASASSFEEHLGGGPGDPPSPPPNLPGPGGTPTMAAQAFDDAFVKYWTGASFNVGTPPVHLSPCPNVGGTTIFSTEATSVVSGVTANVLRGLLIPIFSDINPSTTAAQKASQIATAFDTATKSAVIVSIDGLDTTTPTPVPINNTCTVF